MLTFGNDLWDQLPTIESYTGEGIKLLDSCSDFFRERARMEAEHARSLQKLIKSYLPSARKHSSHHHSSQQSLQTNASESGDVVSNEASPHAALEAEKEARLRDLKDNTLIAAWYTILQQSRVQADEQERLADELSASVAAVQKHFVKEKEQQRRHAMNDALAMKDAMKKQYKLLEKSKAAYDHMKLKADSAKLAHEKVQRDVNASESALNKTRERLTRRNEKALLAETNYQNQLAECNREQENFFKQSFPQKLDEMQRLEEERIDHMKEMLTRFVAVTQRGHAVSQSSYDDMLMACQNINRHIDLQAFIAANKSGEPMPGLIGFQPFNPSLGVSGSYGAYGFLVKPGEQDARDSNDWQHDNLSLSSSAASESEQTTNHRASYASLKPLPAQPRVHVQQLQSMPTAEGSNEPMTRLGEAYAQHGIAHQA